MGNFHVCGPNEAMIKYGCGSSEPEYVSGGRLWVWSCFQQLKSISLQTMTLSISSNNVYTKLGVAVSCIGVAQVKVDGRNVEMIKSAANHFLNKSTSQIQKMALETMEGHQRAIMGNLTVEQIYRDRRSFQKAVFETASADLINMGLLVVSYTLKDVKDSNGYLAALGKTRTAEVKRDALIGEAVNQRDAGIKKAIANREQMEKYYENESHKAKANKDKELRVAANKAEVQTTLAKERLATQLQAAIVQQGIKQAEMEKKIQERMQEVKVQEQEILRRENELEAQVKKPAEAEKYRMETIAEAERNKLVLEAEAKAEVIRLQGEAEAFSIEAKAKAEAEQMVKKADAWREYQDAAIVDMVLKTLPKLAAEVAAPLTQAKRITMISSGRGDVGAAKITSEVIEVIDKLPGMVEKLTVSISSRLNKLLLARCQVQKVSATRHKYSVLTGVI